MWKSASCLGLLLVLSASTALAGTFSAFGPREYSSRRFYVRDQFSVLNPAIPYTIRVETLPPAGRDAPVVVQAAVLLNGRPIIRWGEFRDAAVVEKEVLLSQKNRLQIVCFGCRLGGGVRVEIIGVDDMPPAIQATLSPPPNAAGWNDSDVTISFHCSDAESGVAFCSEPLLVSSEGKNQLVPGRVIDLAGNTTTTEFDLSLDKTPPDVVITSPASGTRVTETTTVKGVTHDALSGVGSVTCNGDAIDFSGIDFSGPMEMVEGENPIEVVATDLAGNTASAAATLLHYPPDLELVYVDEFSLAWRDAGSGGDFDGAYYHPVVPDGYHALGSYGQGNYGLPAGYMFAARELSEGALATPVDFEKIWDDRGSGADLDGSFWRPVPPAGYVCLGVVAMRGFHSRPPLDAVRCVREDLTAPGLLGNTVWLDRGTGANADFGSWYVIPGDDNGIHLGTFTADNRWIPPYTAPQHVIAAGAVQRPQLQLQDIVDMVETFGPDLRLHPDEIFLPDAAESSLDSSTLVWGLVHDEWSYNYHTREIDGTEPVSALSLMDDVETYVYENSLYEDPIFRHWLHLPDDIVPGNLARAKAYVRARPWNWMFTELQFWFYYPFNGPGRVEICLSGNVCEHAQLTTNGRHYGDWEHVDLRIANNPRTLAAVYMSRHSAGQWVASGQFGSPLQFTDAHPIVYSAKYSHAHYPNPGYHEYERVKEYDYGLGTFSVDLYDLAASHFTFSAYDPASYTIVSSGFTGIQVDEPEWLEFKGRWGQYERLSTTFDFTVYAYTYDEVGAGPTGPKRKPAWDHGESAENWWWPANPAAREICHDGQDNDRDGALDCHDDECWAADASCFVLGFPFCTIFGGCPY